MHDLLTNLGYFTADHSYFNFLLRLVANLEPGVILARYVMYGELLYIRYRT